MAVNTVKKLVVVERNRNGEISNHALEHPAQISAQPGSTYTLVDQNTMMPPKGMVLKRKGHDLIIEDDSTQVASIQDFYSDQAAAFSTNGSVSPAAGNSANTISSTTSTAAESADHIVWPIDNHAAGLFGGINPAVGIAGGLAPIGLAASGGGGGSSSSSGSGNSSSGNTGNNSNSSGGNQGGGDTVTPDTTPPSAPASVVLLTSDPNDGSNPHYGVNLKIGLGADVQVGDKIITVVNFNGSAVTTVETIVTAADKAQGFATQHIDYTAITPNGIITDGTYGTVTHLVDAAGNIGVSLVNSQAFVAFTGLVHDDYIANATVFVDSNNNGKWDEGEQTTTTDSSGHFKFTFNPNGAPVLALGGIDTVSGAPSNSVVYKAYSGDMEATTLGVDIVLSPLSTLIAQVAEKSLASGQTIDAAALANAAGIVNSTLGLGVADPSSLLTYDPVAGATANGATQQDIALLTINRQLAVLLGAASSLIDGASATGTGSNGNLATSALADVMLSHASSQTSFNPGSAADVEAVMGSAMAKANQAGVTDNLRVSNPADLTSLAGLVAGFTGAIDTAATQGALSTTSLATIRAASDSLFVALSNAGNEAQTQRGGDLSLADTVAAVSKITDVGSYVATQVAGIADVNTSFETSNAVGYVGKLVHLDIQLPSVGLGQTVDTLSIGNVPAGVTLVLVNPLTQAQTQLTPDANGVYQIKPSDAGYLAVRSSVTAVDNPATTDSTENALTLTATKTVDGVTTTYHGELQLQITPAPAITTVNLGSLTDDMGGRTGSLVSGGSTDDATPTLSGSLSAPLADGQKLGIYDGNTLLGYATVDGTSWTFTPTTLLIDGKHQLTVHVESDGTLIYASQPFSVTVDTTPPTTPTLNPTGGKAVTGTAEPGAVVTVSNGDVAIGTATADANGVWSLTPATPVPDGSTLSATATDAAGNTSTSSSSVIVDAGMPVQQATVDTAIDSLSTGGGTIGNGAYTRDATPTLGGKLSSPLGAGETLVVFDGDKPIGTATVNGTGWTFTPSENLTDGTHTLTVRVARDDVNGTEKLGAASSPITLTVDTHAPTQTITVATAIDDVQTFTGEIANNATFVTNDSRPAFNGTLSGPLASGEALIAYDTRIVNGAAVNIRLGAATVDGTNWTFTPSYALADAVHSIAFRVEDRAGNTSAFSEPYRFTVDTVDTATPVITSTDATADENIGAGHVIFTVKADDSADVSSGVTWKLKAGDDAGMLSINAATGEVSVNSNPDFETKSSYHFTVIATDGAGNSSEKAITVNINNLDESAPTVTSDAVATPINENSGAGQVIYTAAATDSGDISGGVTWSLKEGSDAGLSINATTGKVTLTDDPNYEAKSAYSFTVVATDEAGHATEKTVTLAINNLDEVAPTVTSDAVAAPIDENSGAGQIIYTAVADDTADTSGGVTWSLKAGSDAGLSINATTGKVTLADDPNYEAKSAYSFTVIATDAAGHATEKTVTLEVQNLDEIAPTVTSDAVATPIDENSGAGQVIYTAAATDSGDISGGVAWSLKEGSDAGLSINATTGKVTLADDPNYEAKSAYSFTVVATDAAGHVTEKTVTLAINNLDEVAPTVTSDAVAAPIDENSGAGQIIYTAVADDTADTSGGVTWSLKEGSDAGLSINATTGKVTLADDPNYEAKSAYSFTVIATDAAGHATEKTVTLEVQNLDEIAPTVTSDAVATPIDENSGAGQVIYTAAATDSGDISGGVTWSLKEGSDAGLSINATTGKVTLADDPNYEAKSAYSFTVVATDAAGHATEKTVTLAINNLDEVAPTVTSDAVAAPIAENSGAGQIIYTAVADDTADTSGGVTWSLKEGSNPALMIDSETGAVTLSDNPDYESQSSYTFTVVATDAAGHTSNNTVTLAILNDDAPLSITVNNAEIVEGTKGVETVLTYTVSRTVTTGEGTVDWSVGGDVDADTDLSSVSSGTLSFAAGEASKTFTVTVLGDKTVEADENLIVSLSNPTGDLAVGETGSATTTIRNDDGTVSISVDRTDIVEGNTGSQQVLTYTVTRTNGVSPSSVNWSLSGMDAADLAAGQATTGSVSFAAGETTKTFTVAVIGDRVVEATETLTAILTGPAANLNLGTASASTLVRNDDSLLSVDAVRASVAEGNTGETQVLTFRISRTNGLSATTVDWSLDGTVDAADLAAGQPSSGTVSFAANELEKTVSVAIAGDRDIESNETLTLKLSHAGANASIGVASASTIVVNDDIGISIEAVGSAMVTEGANGTQTPLVFRVLRSDTSASATVDYHLIGVGKEAVGESDFVEHALPYGTVSFDAGQSVAMVTVLVAGDAVVESNETYSVVLTNSSAGTQILHGEVSGAIVNDDMRYSLVAQGNSVLEGTGIGGVQRFTVTREGNTDVAGAVGYAIAGYADNAASGDDFESLLNGVVSFAAGQTVATLTVNIAGDSELEGYEAFKVSLNPIDGNTEIQHGVALATINPDDIGITISAENAMTFEDAQTAHVFTLTRTGYLGGSAVVNWHVEGYGAPGYQTDANDFGGEFPSGTVTFAPGQETVQISFMPSADVTFENNEGYRVVLGTTQPGVILLQDSAQGMLFNDESSLTLQASNLDQMEGNPGDSPALSFSIARSGNIKTESVVHWELKHDDSSVDDFAPGTPLSGTLTFAVGQDNKVVTLPLSVDNLIEADKHFHIVITSETVGTEVLVGQVNGVIRNDDAQFSLQPIADFTEGNGGMKTVTMNVVRTGDLTGSDTVDYTVSGASTGIAASAADFSNGIYPHGTLLFTAGQATQAITLQVAADSVKESDESFTVSLSNNSSGTTIAADGSSHTATILNDDDRLAIAATDAVKPEGGTGTTDYVFTVTRDGFTDKSTVIGWHVGGAGATPANAADFGGTLPSGTVSFDAGQTAQTITVTVSTDNLNEADEGFRVILDTPPAGTEVATASATGTIVNDDTGLAIAATTTNLPEGDSGTVNHVFTVTRSGVVTGETTVDWTLSGTANAADFGGTLPSGTVSFGAGQTVQTITVAVSGDTTIESNEGFTLTLSNASSNADIQVASANGSIVADDIQVAITAHPADMLDEGAAGSTQVLSYTITRSGDTATTAVVDWAATGVDAADFTPGTPLSGSLTFGQGETFKIINLTVKGDNVLENDETVTLSLTNPAGNPAHDHTWLVNSSVQTQVVNDDVALAITANAASVAEGGTGETTPYVFTITPTGLIGADSVVSWRVSSTQAANNDFIGGQDVLGDNNGFPSGTVTFAAGQTTPILVTVNLAGDSDVEAAEGFSVTLSTSADNVQLAVASASAVIDNDDTAYSIVAVNADHAEGNTGTTDYVFNVVRSGVATGNAEVSWTLAGSGANPADANDFGGVLPKGTVTFTGTDTTQTITVSVSGDTVVENNENFTVTLTDAPSPITVATATGTIRNEDQQFAVTAANASLTEGDSGSQPVIFRVTRTGDTSVATTVDYAVTGSNGVDSSDYVGSLPAGTLSFAANEGEKLVTLAVRGDNLVEADESYTLTLATPSIGTLKTDSTDATTVILNNDVALDVTAPKASAEGSANGDVTAFVFTVTRSGATASQSTVVDWVVEGGGVTLADFAAGQDGLNANFGLPSGTLTFAAGETVAQVTVNVAQDTQVEVNETFGITLKHPTTSNVELRTASAMTTIVADDSGYSIAAVDTDKVEGDSGNVAYTFSITRAGDLTQTAVANWAVTGTAGNNPVDADDFGGALPSGAVTFNNGESVKMVTVLVAGDQTAEFDEHFTVTLSNVPGIVDATASGTIRNDDQNFNVSGAANVAEGNSGTQLITYTVTRSGDMSGTATVDYAVDAGSGVDANDYVGNLQSGTLTFAPNQNSAVVTFSVKGDTVVEGDESYTLTLSNATGGATLATSSATTVVTNDDTNYTLSAPGNTFEGASGTTPLVFTVTRSGVLDAAGSVQWKLQGASGLTTADFVGSQDALSANGGLPSGTVSFAAGVSSAAITIAVQGDTTLESNETLHVVLSNAVGGSIEGTNGDKSTVLLTDDDSFSISTDVASRAEGNTDSTVEYTVTRTGSLVGERVLTWTADGTNGFDANDLANGQASSGQVTFADGQTSAVITIGIKGDNTLESDETMRVTLSGQPANTVLGTASASTVLINDDAAVSISALSADKSEGNPIITTPGGDVPANQWSTNFSVNSSGTATGSFEYPGDQESYKVHLIAGHQYEFDLTGTGLDTANNVQMWLSASNGNWNEYYIDNSDGVWRIICTPSATGDVYVTTYGGNAGNYLLTVADKTVPGADVSVPYIAVQTVDYTFNVTRSGELSQASTVEWRLSGDVDTADFAGIGSTDALGDNSGLPSGLVSFGIGQSVQTVTVKVVTDSTVEADESMTVTLSNATSGTSIDTASATGWVRNDDAQLSITSGTSSLVEGDAGHGTSVAYTYTVTRTGNLDQVSTVNWSVEDVSTDMYDFTNGVNSNLTPAGTLNFGISEATKTITVYVAGDTGVGSVENDETFHVVLSNPNPGNTLGTSSYTSTIVNDDTDITVSFDKMRVAEQVDGQSSTYTITLQRTGDVNKTSTVDWTAQSTSVYDSEEWNWQNSADQTDFGGAFPNGHVTFAAGETVKTITITVPGDNTVENDEWFRVDFSNPTNVDQLTAKYDDGRNSAGNLLIYDGSYGWMTEQSTRVYSNYATLYAEIKRDEAIFSVSDNEVDSNGNPIYNRVEGDTTADGGTVGSTVDHVFMVQRTISTAGSSWVTWRVDGNVNGYVSPDANDFAAGSDVRGIGALASGTLSFADGQSVGYITVTTVKDDTGEFDEAFRLSLDGVAGGSSINPYDTGSYNQNIGWLINDDTRFDASVTSGNVVEGNAIVYAIVRNGDSRGADSVDWSLALPGSEKANESNAANSTWYKLDAADIGSVTASDGTVVAGSGTWSGTMTFADGETIKYVTVSTANDALAETWRESMSIHLSNPQNVTPVGETHADLETPSIGNDATAWVLDDEPDSLLSVTVNKTSEFEGTASGNSVTFTITRSGMPNYASTAVWRLDGTNINWGDYGGAAIASYGGDAVNVTAPYSSETFGQVNFAAGETTKTVTITYSPDAYVDSDDRQLTFTLLPASQAFYSSFAGSDNYGPTNVDSDHASATTTLRNDDTRLWVNGWDSYNTSVRSFEGTPTTFTVNRAGRLDTDIVLNYTVVNGSTTNGDFGTTTGTITLAAQADHSGDHAYTISLSNLVADDALVENNESFTLHLSAPADVTGSTVQFAPDPYNNNYGAPSTALDIAGTVYDTDTTYTLAPASASLPENDSAQQTFTFNMARGSNGYTGAATLYWKVVVDSDMGTDDFASVDNLGNNGGLPSGMVNLGSGSLSAAIQVITNGDISVEPDGRFHVVIYQDVLREVAPNVTNAQNISSSVVTLVNDDTGISIADASIVESDANQAMTFLVTRSGDLSGTSTMDWTVNYAAGQAGSSDLTGATSGTLSFAASETTKLVTVTVVGDSLPETNEQFTVTLDHFGGTAAIVDSIRTTATGTIVNDDASFDVVAGANAVEGGSQVFTITRTQSTSQDQVVNWAVSSPTNGADATDFGGTLPSGSVTFAVGELTKSVTVTSNADTTTETDEDFTATFTLGSGTMGDVFTNNGTGSIVKTGTIINNDADYTVTAGQTSAMEGHSGTTPFVFSVSRSGDVAGAATVDWTVSSATADAADFSGGVLPSGTVSFAAGQTTATITVNAVGDTAKESDETFSVTLSNASGAHGNNIVGTPASSTITNDDSSISIVAVSAVKVEGDSATTAYTYDVVRTGYLGNAATVQYDVAGSGAHPADSSDFSGMSGTLNLAAGAATTTLTILVKGDTAAEPDEDFTVSLSNASSGVTIGTASAGGTIVADDVWFDVAAPSAQIEGTGAGTTDFAFVVTRTGALTDSQVISWTVAGSGNDPASADDFAATSGTVTFAPNDTTAVIHVAVNKDAVLEAAENFTVSLSGPAGVHFSHTTAETTIIDDETAFAITPATASLSEGMNGATSFVFTVTRSGNLANADSVAWNFSSTETDKADFVGNTLPAGEVLSFAASETTKTITIDVAGDQQLEGNEHFTLSLSGNSAGTQLVPTATSATATIVNDDSSIAISALSADHAEGQSGTTAFTFNVVRTGDLSSQATVTYTVGGNASITADDFSGLSGGLTGTLTLPSGEATTTLTIYAQGDRLAESDENFTVTLSNPSTGVTIATDSAAGVVRADDVVFDVSTSTPASRLEGADGVTTPFEFVVTRDGKLDGAQEVSWSVAGIGGNAANTADFVATSGTVSFAAGETAHTITVLVKGDYVSEPDESFRLALTGATGDDLGDVTYTRSTADAVILNDEASFTIVATDTNKAEGGNGTTVDHVFTVTRTGNLNLNSTVSWSVAGGDTNAADYAASYDGALPAGVLTFGAGVSVQTITVSTAGDVTTESDENFTVNLANASTGANIITGTANGRIVSDDVSWSVSLQSAPVVEGDSVANYVFRVERTGSTSATSIDWSVNGSDTDGANAADFANGVLPSGNMVFAQGVMTQFITVQVAGDGVREADEGFSVTLTAAQDGLTHAYAQKTATATIVNDDDVMSIAATSADKTEGSSGLAPFTFTVTRDGSLAGSSTVGWHIVHGDTDNADFAATSGTVSFADGQSVATVTVNVIGDRDVEGNQAFSVELQTPGSGSTIDGAHASAGGVIRNDDVDLALSQDAAVVAEGDAVNPGQATFTVTRSGDLSVQTTVNWNVEAGTATAADFANGQLPSGTVVFGIGESVQTITVNLAGDGADEGNEGFTVHLSGQSAHADIVSNDASGTIVDDDDTLTVSTFLSAIKEGNDGEFSNYVFKVERTGTATGSATVDWQVAGSGSHAVGADEFVAQSGSVSFRDGETTQFVTVQVKGDDIGEYDENFTISLHNPSYGSTASETTASATVVNDDATLFVSADQPGGRLEGVNGAETQFTFTVARGGDPSIVSTVDWAVQPSGDTTVNAMDFGGAYPSGTVVFGVGEMTKQVTVAVLGDAEGEFDETFAVKLSNPTHANILEGSATSVILNDDTGISIAAHGPTDQFEGNTGTTEYVYAVQRVGSLDPTTVDWAVVGNGDYQVSADDFVGPTSGTISFTNESVWYVTLQVKGDDVIGPDEAFRVVLSDNDNLINTEATGIIRNDDSVVAISANTPSLVEGDSGVTHFVFTVTRSGDTDVAANVNWETVGSGGHPTDANDFGGTLPSGVVSFDAGQTTAFITVAVSGDTLAETDEGFTVRLSADAGSGVSIDPTAAQASATILGDDQGVLLFGMDVDHLEGQTGNNTVFTYQVLRTGNTDSAVMVNYHVGGDVDENDFVSPLSGSFTMAAGEESRILTLVARGDSLVELDEAFQVGLSGAFESNAPVDSMLRGDDDGISVVAHQNSVSEGSGDVVFDIVANGILGHTTVNWSVPDGALDSVHASDFTGGVLPSGQVTFDADGTQSITVHLADDAVVERDESLTVALSSSGPVSVEDGAHAMVTVTDNDTATSGNDHIAGNETADVLYGLGGADDIQAGGGDDVVIINGDNLAQFGNGMHVDGGTGFDTLLLDDGGQSFDLAAIIAHVQGVEQLDISGTGANTVNIAPEDLTSLAMNLFDVDGDPNVPDALHQLMVKGDANDTVILSGDGWARSETDYTDSHGTFAVYTNEASHVQLLVDVAMAQQNVTHPV